MLDRASTDTLPLEIACDPPNDTRCGDVTLDVPREALLHIVAKIEGIGRDSDIGGIDNFGRCDVKLNGRDDRQLNINSSVELIIEDEQHEQATFNALQGVPPGEHKLEMVCEQLDGDIEIDEVSMTAIAYATD